MPVLVDTCVWSLALRRWGRHNDAEEQLCAGLGRLVEEGAAALLGPVRQEILSGIRDAEQFRRLRRQLWALPHPELEAPDYEHAAEASNRCRARGLAGGSVDFLICGVSLWRQWPILTTDQDFQRYAGVLPLRLLRSSGK